MNAAILPITCQALRGFPTDPETERSTQAQAPGLIAPALHCSAVIRVGVSDPSDREDFVALGPAWSVDLDHVADFLVDHGARNR